MPTRSILLRSLALAVTALVTAAAPARAAYEVPINQLSHIHGIAVAPDAPWQLLLATHEGLYRASPRGKPRPVYGGDGIHLKPTAVRDLMAKPVRDILRDCAG